MDETIYKLSLEDEVCCSLTDFFNDLSDIITNPQINNLEEQIEDCLDKYTSDIVALVFNFLANKTDDFVTHDSGKVVGE